MKQREDILKELREISPTVAAIELVNVFTVPGGYFEAFPGIITERIEFPEKSELLNSIGRSMPLHVPQAYFETLGDTILAQVNEQNTATNFETNRAMPNDMPAGYFDSLAGNILSKIKEAGNLSARDEIESLSPVLVVISKQMPNDVPVGYFEFFADNVREKLEKKEARTVSIFQRKVWVRYAAAAVVTGIIALSAFLISRNNEPQLAQNDPSEIYKPVVKEEDLTKTLAAVADKDLQTLVNSNENITDDAKAEETDAALLAASLNSDKLEDILKQVPDEALKHYADEHSSIPMSN